MNVGFIGAGHIAHALAEGWSRPGIAGPPALAFFDVVAEKAGELAALTNGTAASSMAELVAAADLVIVAVRPEHVEGLLHEIGSALGDRPLVSVAAGVSQARLLAALPVGSRATRVMPNVAAALGLGVFLMVSGSLGRQVSTVTGLFEQAGVVVQIDEDLFDAATAVAGCMPGMLAQVVIAFATAAEDAGVPPDVAVRLAIGGVHGAAALIARQGDPVAVASATATPGGMTAAAIAALEERDLAAVLAAAVHAAAVRARELA
jgi:pyrroline-5-carboxylate reductase